MIDETIGSLRLLHIAAGFVALFVAPGAMLTRKGGSWHRRCGRIYVRAMAIVCASALVLAPVAGNVFLLLVAVFSFYLAFSGARVLRRKRPARGDGPTALDWTAVALVLAGSLGLVILGIVADDDGMRPVPFVFGGIGLVLGGLDVWRFLRPSPDRPVPRPTATRGSSTT